MDEAIIKQLAEMIAGHLNTSEEEATIPNAKSPEDDRFSKIRSVVMTYPESGRING